MNKYDVIIIGGSCAGSSSGYTLAKAGKKVAIIDKEIFPREKLCGGMITEKTLALLKNVYGDISPNEFIDSSFKTFGIYHPDFGKVCKFTHPEDSLYFVNRIVFDNYFFQKAKQAGCDCYNGKKVDRVDEDGVVLEGGEKIFGDFIIGADGANGITRKSITKKFDKKQLALALEVEMNYEDLNCFPDKSEIFPRIYFGYLEYGYAWVFPKRNKVIIGLGGLVSKNSLNMKELFMNFLKQISNKDVDFSKLEIKGFPVPFHNFETKPARGNIFLAGDAAGLVEPITGEGIYFAALSGLFAAESIMLEKNRVENYNQIINKKIISILRQAYFVKKIIFIPTITKFAMTKMKKNAKYCKYYFDLLSGKIDYWTYAKQVLNDRNKYISE